MYNVVFYETASGSSDVRDFLEELRARKKTDKSARIQYNQIALCIQLLRDNGTQLPVDIAKFIDDGIWELRPGNNRVFYFYYKDNTYVLLHHFRKRTQKTPKRELDKAKAERDDFLSRKENTAK